MSKAIIVEPGYESYDLEQHMLAPLGMTLERLPADLPRHQWLEKLSRATLVFVRDTRLDAEAIAAAPALRAIVRHGVGVDNIDLEAARQHRIPVANVPDYGAGIEVADHTLALFLAVARRIVSRDRQVRQGAWDIAEKEPMGRIAGKTLGLLGYGRIGRGVHQRFAAFGVERVLVFDPYLDQDAARKQGVTLVDLAQLAAEADIVSVHAPSGDDNRLISADFIAAMRPGAILVNTARGSHVDEVALAAALRNGRLAGAGLDVFAQEPPPTNGPLHDAPNVVMTDHMGWFSTETVAALHRIGAEEAVRMLSGDKPKSWVNPW